jgi:hypothetical protein
MNGYGVMSRRQHPISMGMKEYGCCPKFRRGVNSTKINCITLKIRSKAEFISKSQNI